MGVKYKRRSLEIRNRLSGVRKAIKGQLKTLFRLNKSKPVRDVEFTGAYPRFSGAMSAVTGGPPEDMNEMPATNDPEREGPIYDGSTLSGKKASGTASA